MQLTIKTESSAPCDNKAAMQYISFMTLLGRGDIRKTAPFYMADPLDPQMEPVQIVARILAEAQERRRAIPPHFLQGIMAIEVANMCAIDHSAPQVNEQGMRLAPRLTNPRFERVAAIALAARDEEPQAARQITGMHGLEIRFDPDIPGTVPVMPVAVFDRTSEEADGGAPVTGVIRSAPFSRATGYVALTDFVQVVAYDDIAALA